MKRALLRSVLAAIFAKEVVTEVVTEEADVAVGRSQRKQSPAVPILGTTGFVFVF